MRSMVAAAGRRSVGGAGRAALRQDRAVIAAGLLSIAAPQVATMRCGAGAFRLVSRTIAGAAPLAPANQTMTRRTGARWTVVPLEPARRVAIDGYAVRARYVASWACVTGGRGVRYLVLGYGCAVDPPVSRACGGRREWVRLFDERGRAVDGGRPVDGAAGMRLQRRLGIAAAMRRGVAMRAVVR